MDDVYGEILDKLEEEQLLEFSGDRIRLTHRGMDVSNCVLAEFLFKRQKTKIVQIPPKTVMNFVD